MDHDVLQEPKRCSQSRMRDRHLMMEILEGVEMRPRYHLCTNALAGTR